MLCPIKVNSETIELTVHTSCYSVLDLLCVNLLNSSTGKTFHAYGGNLNTVNRLPVKKTFD